MSRYLGETYNIPLERGGFCHNKNIDTIDPFDMIHPSCNIWLNEGGIRKRGGTAIVDTISTSGQIVGLFDFWLANGNQKIVRVTSDGKIWKDNTNTIKTGWTVDKLASIIQAEDVIYICSGADLPVTWNGTDAAVTNFANVPTDWTGSNYPAQMILHGRGNSLRNWALGCPLNPKTIYVSANDDLDDFTQATVLTFYLETGDGAGIIGGIEYGNRLLLFGRNKSFIMEDASTDTTEWGYTASQWEGGVAHQRLIAKTPNDVVCMMENGEIYSVAGAESYGDYKAASLSRPSFMHEWIKTYVNLAQIAKFHAIYDPILRAIQIFVVRTGENNVDTALVYFIDRPPEKAWVILQNTDFESGYSARSSALVRQSVGAWKLYAGGYNGKLWKLGEVNRNDNSNAFMSRFKTPNMSFENVRESKRYDRIKIISIAEGSCDAEITWWIDGKEIDSETLNFATSGDVLGSFILGTGTLGGVNILESSVRVGAIGKRLQLESKSNTANESFFLSQFLVDFVPLGKRA